MSPPCLQKHFRHVVVVPYPLLRYRIRPRSFLLAVVRLLRRLGRFPQPVFPLEEIRRRGNIPAALLFPCVRVLPLPESVENAGQARKGPVGLKGYPFAFGFIPSTPVPCRERLEELVKRHGRMSRRGRFRLLRFGGPVLFRLGTFNARARVKHALVFFFWRRRRKRGIARIMLGQRLSIH